MEMEIIKKAREKYENELVSFRGIAREFGKYHGYWSAIAKKEGWEKYTPPTTQALTSAQEAEEQIRAIKEYGGAEELDIKKLLSPTAMRKIREICTELGDMYSSLDEQMIMTYALAYQRSLKLESIVQEKGEILYSAEKGTPYFSPYYAALLASNKEMIQIARDFGMSVASRKRNALDFGQKKNEPTVFDRIQELLQGDIDIDEDSDY